MTKNKTAAAVIFGVAAFVAIGIWAASNAPEPVTVPESGVIALIPGPAPARVRAPKPEAPPAPIVLTINDPLAKRLKPVLQQGTDLSMAADGFRNLEQFATVAHAARNTEVPFMVLKDRVVTQGKSLVTALKELKPQVNAKAEAARARAEALKDVVVSSDNGIGGTN